MKLGDRIKAARTRLVPRPTQADVAKVFDVTVQAVSGWERNDSIPELDKVARLARILKVPTKWLLDGKGPPPAPDSLETAIEGLDPAKRALLEAMAKTLLQQRNTAA